jgi:hypothetical protein
MPYERAMLLTGREIEPTLAVVRPDGSRWHGRLEVGKVLDVPLAGRTVRIAPLRFFEHAAKVYELEPQGAGQGGDGRRDDGSPHDAEGGPHDLGGPVLSVTARAGDWKRTTFVPLAAYEHLAPPLLVDLPGNRAVWLGFSRRREDLPATIKVISAEYLTYPASGIPKDYRCRVEILSGGQRRPETLSLNHPVQVGAFQFSQNSWGPDPAHTLQISLGAASRPGLWAVWTGCILICLGLPIAFYVKPLLMRAGGRQ